MVEAISQRFDNITSSPATLLSEDENNKARKDREDLDSKKMHQRVIVNSITVQENKITVDADRLISVDTVRSAFGFPLEVTIASVDRSERNPYGLVLSGATEIQSNK